MMNRKTSDETTLVGQAMPSYQSVSPSNAPQDPTTAKWDAENAIKDQVDTGITTENDGFSWAKLSKYTGPGMSVTIVLFYVSLIHLFSSIESKVGSCRYPLYTTTCT